MKQSAKEVIARLGERYPALAQCLPDLTQAIELLINCYRNQGKLLVCGNGGSAADAQHVVGEMMKSFVLKRNLPESKKKLIEAAFPEGCDYLINNLQDVLPAVSLLGETALTSAYANDMAPDLVFAQQVLGLGKEGDVLLAISTSGRSSNVLYACRMAAVQKMKVIGLTGQPGGLMRDICNVTICVPSGVTYQIQEYHVPVYHAICMALEYEFFGEG